MYTYEGGGNHFLSLPHASAPKTKNAAGYNGHPALRCLRRFLPPLSTGKKTYIYVNQKQKSKDFFVI